jgi:predicted  nucleic acid-binding Zn-ribbon protein
MSRLLEVVVALQQAMGELRAGENKVSGVPESMRELHEEHGAHRREIEALEAAVEKARRERVAAEGAISDAQEKLKHYQQQVSLVRNQREYGALLAEIDAVKGQARSLEEQALEAMERVETAQKELEGERSAFTEVEQRYAVELAQWEAEKPTHVAQVAVMRGKVDELATQLPKPVLARVQRLLERYRGEALAPIRLLDRMTKGPQVWICGVCNYRVRPAVVVEIRNDGALLECDSCKRLLFFEP